MNGPLAAPAGILQGFTASPPDPRLLRCVLEIRRIVAGGRPSGERLAGIAAAGAGLARSGFRMGAEHRQVGAGPYGRNLVYRDPDFGFVAIAMIWPAGCDAPVHDHGTWCAVTVLEGRVEVACYRRSSRRSCELAEESRSVAGVGDTCTVLPPLADVHKVWNPFSQDAVTLHVYGRDITCCSTFDLQGGSRAHRELGYANL